MNNGDVLVIGAGIAGIEASLLLAGAGRRVYLVEKTSYIGGNVIKYEHVFSNMECATCMVAPKQQELLGNEDIKLLTLSEVFDVEGSSGNFVVKVRKRARYVDPVNCIGCNTCFDPCPVSLKNEFEEGLGERKAIYIPCAGALPNVPAIDPENCVRFQGKDCQACKEACMFDAINFDEKDEELELKVGAILVATGFSSFNPNKISQYGYGKFGNVYTAFEFERIFASNGPTGGKILLRNGQSPKSVAILHCVGRKEKGYCSAVCCMYSLKFIHYLKDKLPEVKIYELYSDLCIPGKSYQKFYEEMKEKGADIVRAKEFSVVEEGKGMVIKSTLNGKERNLPVDMVILAPAMEPRGDASKLAKILDVPLDEHGFFREEPYNPVATPREGVFIAGCAQDPKDIQGSVAQSEAAVGRILATP